MAEGEEYPAMWVAGVGIAGLTMVYIWILGDPMLVYLSMVTAIMATFPTYKQIIAFVSLLGIYRLALRHDVITGDFASFVTSVGEGLDITVGGTAAVVTLMAMWPAMRALFSFDAKTVIESVRPAVPLLVVVITRFVVENKADANVMEMAGAVIQHVKDFVKNVRVFTGLAR